MPKTDSDALTAAYHHAKPLMEEIAPRLYVVPGYLGSLAAVAKLSRVSLDKDNVDNATEGLLRIFDVLQEVALSYHAVAKAHVDAVEKPTESEGTP
jgi:hypothetical protein